MSDIVDTLYRGATWMTDADCIKAASEICRLRARVADLSVGAPGAVDEWSTHHRRSRFPDAASPWRDWILM